VNEAMDSIHARCYTLDMMGEEIKGCVKNEKPDIREKTLHWLTSSISSISKIEMYKEDSAKSASLHLLSDIFENALSDANQAVRKAAQSGIKAMRSLQGKNCEKIVDELLSRLQKSHSRVYNAIMSVSSSTTTRKVVQEKKKMTTTTKPKKTTKKKNKVEPAKQCMEEEKKMSGETTTLMEMDDALEVFKTFEIADTVGAALKEKKWKEKKESLNFLTNFVSEKPKDFWKDNKTCLVAIFSACYRATREFKDSNFNIVRAAFELIETMSKYTGSQLNRSLADRVLGPATAKIGDRKTGPQAVSLILALAEFSCGPRFVCLKMISASAKIRAPLALIGICNVLSQMVEEFTIRVLPSVEILSYACGKQGFGHSNAKLRTAASELLVSIYAQAGESVVEKIKSSVNAAGMKTLQKKFEGVEVLSKVEAKRQVSQDLVSEIASESEASVKRVDISSNLTYVFVFFLCLFVHTQTHTRTGLNFKNNFATHNLRQAGRLVLRASRL